MKCVCCNFDKPETVTLWDGKEYCVECTRSVHKDLYAYARHHKVIASNYRYFINFRTVVYLLKMEFMAVLIVFACFFFVAYLGAIDQGIDFDVIGVVVLFCILLMFPLSVLPVRVSLRLRRAISRHPHISIACGKVTLAFQRYMSKSSFGNEISLPLSSVKLQSLPLSRDIYLPYIAQSNKEQYSLMDFSECIDESYPELMSSDIEIVPLGGIVVPFEKKRWRESPYLCFTSSRFENEIIEAFFRLLERSQNR